MRKDLDKTKAENHEKPPFFKSWKGFYWLLIGFLIFQIIIYYIITIVTNG